MIKPHDKALLLVLMLPLSACAEEREYGQRAPCVAWKQDVGALLEERCVGCHGGDDPAGGYALDTYLRALGDGSDDAPNIVSGDAMSALLVKIAPGSADAVHEPFTDLHPTLSDWIVTCDVAFTSSPIHEPGILNPHDEDFHGELLRESGYDFDRCAECHGEDFGGGRAEASCTTCHENGPTDCTTCHSDLLERGAHAAHLPDGPAFGDDCATCHEVPSVWSVPGHVLLADGTVDPSPAEVMLSGKAAVDGESDAREGPPAYDPEQARCANVYCHGDTFADTAAALTEPVWIAEDQAVCGTCHGIPPSNHAQDDCVTCHGQVIDASMSIIAPELHVDTVVQVGGVDGGCSGCHGSPESPAPPPDLAGGTSTSLVTVGAHAQHLFAPFRLRGPVACSDCHRVPTAVDDPGHIDDDRPAEVFPATIAGGSLAFADGASPSFDRGSASCSDVYCHGGGATLSADTSPGLVAMPTWTSPFDGAVYCGSCHGVPPTTGIHTDTMTLFDCTTCHPSVDAFGNIVLDGPAEAPTSLHINGAIDVR